MIQSFSDGSVENIALLRQRLAKSGGGGAAHLCLRLNDVSFASNKTFQHISRCFNTIVVPNLIFWGSH